MSPTSARLTDVRYRFIQANGIRITLPNKVKVRSGEQMENNVPNLEKSRAAGVGHWTQQEAPEDVNRLILEFLRTIDGQALAD
jgi:pimeloyl-ACP methyl ester carboxylesterase